MIGGLKDATVDDLMNGLVTFDPARSESLLYAIRGAVSECVHDGRQVRYTLQHYIDNFVEAVELGGFNTWGDKEWGTWGKEQRANYLRDTSFPWRDLVYWDGDNLRELRSKLIEDWLASPEPPRKSLFGIPHRIEDSPGSSDGN